MVDERLGRQWPPWSAVLCCALHHMCIRAMATVTPERRLHMILHGMPSGIESGRRGLWHVRRQMPSCAVKPSHMPWKLVLTWKRNETDRVVGSGEEQDMSHCLCALENVSLQCKIWAKAVAMLKRHRGDTAASAARGSRHACQATPCN